MYETTNFLIRIRNIIMPSKINIADTIKEISKEVEEKNNPANSEEKNQEKVNEKILPATKN